MTPTRARLERLEHAHADALRDGEPRPPLEVVVTRRILRPGPNGPELVGVRVTTYRNGQPVAGDDAPGAGCGNKAATRPR